MEPTKSQQVMPPANGKKLWRVKRSVSGPHSSDLASLMECLNNSLKISAAGNQYLARRPPLRRPKTKPGMPKDFVFVDLSPVKTDDEPKQEVSPSLDLASLNESFGLLSSDDDLIFSSIMDSPELRTADASMDFASAPFDTDLGLGLMNVDMGPHTVDWNQHQQQIAFQQFLQYQQQMSQYQYQQPVSALPDREYQIPNTNKRSKSTSAIPRKKSSPEFQFKTYKGPSAKKARPQNKHRHTVSEPIKPQTPVSLQVSTPTAGLEDFMALNKEIRLFLDDTLSTSSSISMNDGSYTPVTDISESEDIDHLHKPLELDSALFGGCSDIFARQEEFDFNSFVSI